MHCSNKTILLLCCYVQQYFVVGNLVNSINSRPDATHKNYVLNNALKLLGHPKLPKNFTFFNVTYHIHCYFFSSSICEKKTRPGRGVMAFFLTKCAARSFALICKGPQNCGVSKLTGL